MGTKPIERIPFGRTGHRSSRVIFGAAALWSLRQEKADRLLETLLEHGVNHIDTAAGYGESEVVLAPWLREHPGHFFLATKTRERSGDAARAGLEKSLERLGVDSVGLIQLHNLVDEDEWQAAFAAGGAVDALAQARDEGLVRHVGVTGHGTYAPAMHLRSLERFPFASVLAPCNYTMLANPEYASDFAKLVDTCGERGVAVQTIKSVARRRWTDEESRRFSWYEPLLDPDAIGRAVHFVLSRPGLFLNTSSDARILPLILDTAEEAAVAPPADAMAADVARYAMEPLFVRGESDAI
jgi:aryl-alcohol dehydrogenase-like predicted oxidoreductase